MKTRGDRQAYVKTELVWTKNGFDYALRVRDGYLFVKGWRKRRVPVIENFNPQGIEQVKSRGVERAKP